MVVLPAPQGGWRVQVQAGAGLVADSQPAAEYQETLNKARGMLKALACLQPRPSSNSNSNTAAGR
jgi:anthranilate synthase component 1